MERPIKKGLPLLITAAFLAGCSGSSQSAEELLNDPVKQEEIMTAIVNDHQMTTKMMDYIMKNDHAMQAMSDHRPMMMNMMGNAHRMRAIMMQDTSMSRMMMTNMMKLMEEDSATCNSLSSMMMGNDHMMNAMMDMMRKKGMKLDEGKREKTHTH